MNHNILLTGGHSGIGLELTKILLREGHRVGLIVRGQARADAARAALGPVDVFHADLSDQAQLLAVTQTIAEAWERIDVLFNNAAVLLPDLRRSPQGNELHYEVNTLAPYLLATQLRPLLRRADAPVVVNTVSDSMAKERAIDEEQLLRPRRVVKLFGSYLQSKLALTALSQWMSRDPAWAGVRIVCVSPGPNKTDMTRGEGMPAWLVPLRHLLFAAPTKGARRLYRAAFDPIGSSGAFIKNDRVLPLKFELDREQAARLLSGVAARAR